MTPSIVSLENSTRRAVTGRELPAGPRLIFWSATLIASVAVGQSTTATAVGWRDFAGDGWPMVSCSHAGVYWP